MSINFKRYYICKNCGTKMTYHSNTQLCCYNKGSHGWVSGCGMRAAYNKHWKYCPYCGRGIANLSKWEGK